MLEESWVYFLSFGLVFEIPKLFMTSTQATAFFAVAFPYFIISAVAASPRRTYAIHVDEYEAVHSRHPSGSLRFWACFPRGCRSVLRAAL